MIGTDPRTPAPPPTDSSPARRALGWSTRVTLLRLYRRRDVAQGQPEPRPHDPTAAADRVDPFVPVSA